MAYIYKITNLINKKCYVGQTNKTVEYRWKEHINCLNKKECLHRPLYKAFLKYGISNFKIEEIEECEDNLVNEREIYWIAFFDSYKNGYNLTIGGEGNTHIDKNEVITLWNKNMSIAEIAEKLKCNRNTIAVILDILKIPVQERLNRGYQKQGKAVYQIDKNTDEIIAYYATMSDAARAIGMKNIKGASNISDVCRGKRKTCYGFKWKFAEE